MAQRLIQSPTASAEHPYYPLLNEGMEFSQPESRSTTDSEAQTDLSFPVNRARFCDNDRKSGDCVFMVPDKELKESASSGAKVIHNVAMKRMDHSYSKKLGNCRRPRFNKLKIKNTDHSYTTIPAHRNTMIQDTCRSPQKDTKDTKRKRRIITPTGKTPRRPFEFPALDDGKRQVLWSRDEKQYLQHFLLENELVSGTAFWVKCASAMNRRFNWNKRNALSCRRMAHRLIQRPTDSSEPPIIDEGMKSTEPDSRSTTDSGAQTYMSFRCQLDVVR